MYIYLSILYIYNICLRMYTYSYICDSVAGFFYHFRRHLRRDVSPQGQHGNWRDHCGIDELRPGSLWCRHHLLLGFCLRGLKRNHWRQIMMFMDR